ncbi:MAG: DUF2141 domain-containing protein [Spirochaetes bacterium]|nr:DUF2141 domain-containing protein [Spirochaetota bacterium]
MRRVMIVVVSCIFFCGVLYAESASVILRVDNIEHMEGNLMVALYDSVDAFNNAGKPVGARRVKVNSSTMKIVFDDLKPGTYGVMVYHDRNQNNKLDTMPILGIPREPCGLTNNPELRRAPRFSDAAFEVSPGGNTEVIHLFD